MWNVVLDAVLDSLKVLPFLLLLYVVIEIVEEKVSTGAKFFGYTRGKFATFVGAGLGLIPQCGFSVIAADLYARRYIKMGTLLAIFIATSDEAIVVILSHPEKAYLIFPILLIKFIFALLVGYGVDFVLKKHYLTHPLLSGELKDISAKNHNHSGQEQDHETTELESSEQELEVDGCCGHNTTGKRNTLKQFFVHPLIHSLKVFAYVLIINFVMGALVSFVGEETVIGFMQNIKWLQPVFVAFVGLIPNCASSVLITQLYLMGGISFGATISGLCVNAGIAFAVLFKENKSLKNNLIIVGLLLTLSVVLGYLLLLIV